jgi:hypothetical protein
LLKEVKEMKGKTLLSLAIVAALIVAAMPMINVKAVEPCFIEVEFVENGLNEITKAPGQEFQIAVKINNAPQISQYIVELQWDPTVVDFKTPANPDADIIQGPFLRSFGGTVFLTGTISPGHIEEVTEALLATPPYATGTGNLFYVNLVAKAIGETTIILVRAVLLRDLDMVTVDYTVNGTVHVPPPPATPPTAVISAPPSGAMFTVPVDVLLDGSASTDGYDTLPTPGHTCPITEWKWEIDLGNDGIIDDTVYGATYTYHFSEAMLGQVGITLTVTAPDPTPPTAPDYVDHNSMKIVIMLVPPSVGPDIDVFTDRGGEGHIDEFPYPYGWSDAYGPQEEVCVCAKVTYNGEPVEYKPVGFEIVDPHGVSRDFRVAFTNDQGLACITFRIPWEGSNAENLFGVWSITGTVDIAEVTVTDTVKFKFGYLLNTTSITVAPSAGQYKLGYLTIDVEIENIAFSSKDALLTIVACDVVGVPIGIAKGPITVDPEGTQPFVGFTIQIPKWAFVGTGTIYVNLFTNYPTLGGVPYCPEATASFIVLKTP